VFGDARYLLIIIFAAVLGAITQAYVNGTFRRWSQVRLESGRTGAEVARQVLDAEGLQAVTIEQVGGHLSDHYDPRHNVLRLSQSVYGSVSVAAAGVAAHEAGHAVQHARGYVFARIRMALVPVANFGSQAAWILILLGLFIGLTGLAWAGVIAFAAAVAFQIVTLPVEFDASRRALAALSSTGSLSAGQVGGARTVLTAAALTYLAAALISVLQLLYWTGVVGRRD